MKKWYGLFASLWFTAGSWANETIQITTSEWPPYVSQHAPHYGYISHLITKAFAEVNIDVEFVFQPWARAYEEAKEGRVDATSYWYEDDKHKAAFYLSDSLSIEKVVFFRRKSDSPLRWQSLADFDDTVFGLTRGMTYTATLWQYAEQNKHRISIVSDNEQNIKMLLLGRIDVFPIEEVVGWNLIHNLYAKEQANRIEVMQPPLSVRDGHLLFPKSIENSRRLVELFNQGLSVLRQKGIIDELREQLILGGYTSEK